MPLIPLISATQSIGYNNLITLSDVSTGTDLTITSRRVYIRTAANQYLTEIQQSSSTPAYTTWSYADATIPLNVLTEATSPEITVEWYAGATLVYTFTDTFTFALQNYVFALGKLADQTSSPGVLQDLNYYNTFIQFIVNLFNAENAIDPGEDIYSSQGALNRNQLFIDNESLYF